MRWEWLLFILLFALFNDWPWLLALVGLSWLLSWGHWPASPMPLVVELVLAFAVEVALAALVPRRRVQRMTTGATLEGAALGGFVLLWGTFPGLMLWQASLGFDAASRMHTVMVTAGKRAVLRGGRVAAGILFIVLYHAGVSM